MRKNVRAVEMKTRMIIQRRQPGNGWESGDYPWKRVGEVFCRVRQAKGAEQLHGASQVSVQKSEIICRRFKGINTGDRLYSRSDETYYAVESIVNHESNNRYQVIVATVSENSEARR